MKRSFLLTLFCLISFSACPVAGSAATLPEEIVVGTEPVASSEFKAWSPKNATEYTGSYSGDIGGDTEGKLEIKVVESTEKKGVFVATGTLVRKTAGQKAQKINFTQAALNTSGKVVSLKIGKANVSFVTHGKKPGIIIEEEFAAFIPKAEAK